MGKIRLTGATSGYTELKAAEAAGNNTITLPTTNGGEVIVSDSSGNVNIDSGTLYVDAVNNRVGLGTSVPGTKAHLYDASDVAIKIESGGANYVETNYVNTSAAYTIGIRPDTSNSLCIRDNTSSATRVVLDSSGRVGVGTTSPTKSLEVAAGNTSSNGILVTGSSSPRIQLTETSGNVTTWIGADANAAYVGTLSNHPYNIYTNSLERCRVDTSGRLLVGTSSTSASASAVFQGYGGTPTGPALVHLCTGTATPTAELGYIIFGNSAQNEGASITAWRDGGTWTSGSSHPSRLVFSTTADGASSPTERMRINNDGNVMIGKTATGLANAGVELAAGGSTMTANSTIPLYVNRGANDGTLVEFRQDNVTEGSISVSGTTVSYNGAHLSRWSQLPSGQERTEILRGSVLSNIDEMCEWGEEGNEQLNRMKVSDVEGDKNVSGVFQAWDDDDDTYTNDFYCAMTGDFIIRIGAGVTVERGDLLMSAGDGTAKPQDDDIIRSKTIAKVTSTNVSCTYPDGSYCVPCVLMAC